jgi:hypothetical protein
MGMVAGCSSTASSGASATSTSVVKGCEPPTETTRLTTPLGSPATPILTIKTGPATVLPSTTTSTTAVSVPPTVSPPESSPPAPSGALTGQYRLQPSRSSSAPTGSSKQALMMASKDGYDRSFLVAVVGDRVSEYRPNDGWRLTKINDDPIWEPAIFAHTANALVGGRYVVYREPTLEGDNKPQHQMTVFDTQTSTFNALLPAPTDVFYFGNDPWLVDDHTINILVGRQITMAKRQISGGNFFSRTIDVVTGMYNDVLFDDSLTAKDIDGPSQDGEYLIPLTPEDVVTVENGVAHLNRRPPDAKTRQLIGLVDGIAQERWAGSSSDAFHEVLTRDEFAYIPSWRRVEMQGWSGRIGYFAAASTDATSDPKVDIKFGPTVFDAATQSWDFVYADRPLILDDREFVISMFVVGVVPAPR